MTDRSEREFGTTTAPLTAPFARPGGMILLVKGQRADEELAEAARVLGKLRITHSKTVATPTGKIVVLRRGGDLPKRILKR